MDDPAVDDPAPPPRDALPLLWANFVGSHVILLAISFFVAPEPGALGQWAVVLGIPALVTAGLAVEGEVLARAAPQLQTWFVLRFALAEVAGVLGFVAYYVSGEHLVQGLCAAVGLVAHLACFPSRGARERYALARR